MSAPATPTRASNARHESHGHELPNGIHTDPDELGRVLFDQYPDAGALEFLVDGETVLYVLPWQSGGPTLAGYEQELPSFSPRPVEVTHDRVRELLQDHRPRSVSVTETPAWVLAPTGRETRVTWHARVRYADRIEPMADPAPDILDAYDRAGYCSHPRLVNCRSLYDPTTDLVILVDRSRGREHEKIVSVATTDEYDVERQHWRDCPSCGTEYDPTRHTEGCPYHD